MRIFVAGATGAIGRRLVRRLVDGGHDVFGMTRTHFKSHLIRELGAEPVVADALDEQMLHDAVTTVRPDVIVHELTDLAGQFDLSNFDRTFATSNRLRTTGTDYLMAAARDCGVKRIVAQSFCGWTYARIGDDIKTEDDPLDTFPPNEMRATLEALSHLEHVITTSMAPEGVVLRYGAFYGPGTGVFDPALVDQIRRRRMPVIGGGTGWWSFVHVDDAADATVRAIERGHGIYNIVDDEPAMVIDWLTEEANLLGARPPYRVPAWLARLAVGEHVVMMMTEQRAGSNAKARAELGWQPAHPSWRSGFAEAAQYDMEQAA